MRLSTISHRIEERFVQPLDIGRAKILVRKCMDSENNSQNDGLGKILLFEESDNYASQQTEMSDAFGRNASQNARHVTSVAAAASKNMQLIN